MAKIDDLLDDIPDPRLRSELRQAVNELRSARTFGLVFEDHIPEEVALPGLPVRTGSIVQNRTRPDGATKYEVIEVDGDEAQVRPVGNGDESTTAPVRDLMVVRRFGEPIYPGLTQVGEVRRGPNDKPAHAVINAENFHALQMLTYTHAGKIDVIYADPPYNTGDKSWKYNNRFVDVNDQWRHSKWLSMMEKRLRLARVLLKPDGVLIVTIDEHEVHHLGLLLEQLFPDAYRQMVTIVITARGVAKQGLARVEEYALFAYTGNASASLIESDLLTDRKSGPKNPWASLLRRGTGATAKDRPGMVYPILVDPDRRVILGAGRTLTERIEDGELQRSEIQTWMPPQSPEQAWPVRSDGSLGRWQVSPSTLQDLLDKGYVKLGRFDEARPSWAVNYLKSGPQREIDEGGLVITGRDPTDGSVILQQGAGRGLSRPKTVWRRTAHDAGTYGSSLLRSFLGDRVFDFPKSLYSVRDTLATVVRERPHAVVLDFFAGSGTTLHAIALLNAKDGGDRRCMLVTNSDLSDDADATARAAGRLPGDAEYEALGIFEAVTRPRCEAAVTGNRPDGSPVPGQYLSDYLDRPHAAGLDENVSFFRLDYLDPDVVSVGRQYSAIAPLLWLAAGSVGRWADREGDEPWSVPESSNYAVLFDEDRFADFRALVEGSERIGHVWLVTNSSQSFAEMRAQLPDGLEVQMLYRDYLSNFRLNTAETVS